jgi:inositol transporter-like SP family MFS transporter
MSEMDVSGVEAFDQSSVTRTHWRWTSLAALADYLDAGLIVAGATSLLAWVQHYHLSTGIIGILSAFSANGIAAAVGAWLGGPLGDRFGRRAIYSADLLLYMLGVVIVIFSASPVMLIAGLTLGGLAVGIDVPTSWSLIAEYAPPRGRAQLMGLTNVLWLVGPAVVSALALAFSPLGLLGSRLVFVTLFMVAAATYLLRRKALIESPRWSMARGRQEKLDEAFAQLRGGKPGEGASERSVSGAGSLRFFRELRAALRRPGVRRGLAFIIPAYAMAGIMDGTGGQFTPYLIHQFGHKSATISLLLNFIGFAIGASLVVIYMLARLGDRVNRRGLYSGTQLATSAGFWMVVFVSFTIPVVPWIYVLVTQFNSLGRWPLDRVWSVELYPTEVRATLQSAVWGLMRLAIGIWSLFVADILAGPGIRMLALIMGLLALAVASLGAACGPRTQGASLEQIQEQRDQVARLGGVRSGWSPFPPLTRALRRG